MTRRLHSRRGSAPAVEQPGLAQVIDLLQHNRRDNARPSAGTCWPRHIITLSLDELMIIVTEMSRSIFDQLAAQLMLRTPEEVAALKKQIRQLAAAEPDGGTA